jgi:multicomponent K+:H+ antiporter subunit E
VSGVRLLLPAPGSSVVLAAVWLLLANDLSAGQLALAVLFGLALPPLTVRFRAMRKPLRRIDVALALAAVFLYDVVKANIVVALAVLGPLSRLRPRFVRVPLDLEDPAAIALLAALVTLIPGTVSVDIDRRARVLTVHALLADDERAVIEPIKTRYEARIREVFQC